MASVAEQELFIKSMELAALMLGPGQKTDAYLELAEKVARKIIDLGPRNQEQYGLSYK